MYHHIGPRKDLVLAYGTSGVPAWQRRILPVAFPAMTALIYRVLDVHEESAARSLRIVRSMFDEVGGMLEANGGRHLVGDRFTAADLTFAALAAPAVLPEEYGVTLPSLDELPPEMATVVTELRAHPAGAHALATYRIERRRGVTRPGASRSPSTSPRPPRPHEARARARRSP